MKYFLESFFAFKKDSRRTVVSFLSSSADFFNNMQVQVQHPHQWAPFQVAGLLHAWQISHYMSRYVYHEGQ